MPKVIVSVLKHDFQETLMPSGELEVSLNALASAKEKLLQASGDALYSTQAAFMHSPFDQEVIDKVLIHAREKRALNPAIVFLIGIGGSNLGALAVFRSLYGGLFNDLAGQTRFYCADTTDDLLLGNLLQCAEEVLKSGREMVIIIASKSGTTLETLMNASFFIELLKKYRSDYSRFVIVLTEKESSLGSYAKEHKMLCIDVPKNVGGRYSIFTATGLFPLAMLGIDIKALCSGAHTSLFDEAASSAAVMYYYYKKNSPLYNIFLSSPRFFELGLWYRQLIGESLGKRFDLAGKRVEAGITPIVSTATADLHSVGQLYLGGPRDKLTLFITDANDKPGAQSLALKNSVGLLPDYLEKKSIEEIKDSIMRGVMHAYKSDGRPFVAVDLSPVTPEALGAFLYAKMIEIVCLGFLMHVDPFDQPQVEEYKRETQRILKS